MKNRTDLGSSLNDLVNFMFIKYSGCLIEKTSTGYRRGKEEFKTLDAAKAKIDSSFLNWKIAGGKQ